jgi:hypothetical protein
MAGIRNFFLQGSILGISIMPSLMGYKVERSTLPSAYFPHRDPWVPDEGGLSRSPPAAHSCHPFRSSTIFFFLACFVRCPLRSYVTDVPCTKTDVPCAKSVHQRHHSIRWSVRIISLANSTQIGNQKNLIPFSWSSGSSILFSFHVFLASNNFKLLNNQRNLLVRSERFMSIMAVPCAAWILDAWM